MPLIVVLLFAALITSLAAVASRATASGAFAAATFADAMRADELGRAAADLVAYNVASGANEAWRGGSVSAHLATAELSVDYLSESARVDVNTAAPRFLGLLLQAAGAERDLAAQTVERIIRARQSAPRPRQQAGAAPARPLGLQRTEEIIAAWGLPADLYRAVQPALTVANSSSKVDPTLASRLVIIALFEGDEDRADDFLEKRMQGFVNQDDALEHLPDRTQTFAGFIPIRNYRALAQVTVGRRFRRSYELLVALPVGNTAKPPAILSWQPLLR